MSEVETLDKKKLVTDLNKTLLIPLGIFLMLVAVLAIGFKLDDPHLLPSVLINRPFPAFELKQLNDPQALVTQEDLKGEVSLVNVWATWCPNCVIEHPELTRIATREGVKIYGINYNDSTPKAERWLIRYGDPYQFNIIDDQGKLGIDLGVYGAPETFVIDADGVIQFKHVGIVSRRIWKQKLEPLIQHLRQKRATEIGAL